MLHSGLLKSSIVPMLFSALPMIGAAAEFSARDLAAEEGKFAAYSVANGMRAAFLAFFADDSILLRPDPVDAKTFLRARPEPPIVLDWKSQITILSASGDLGFSTGPSRFTSKTDPTAAPSFGQFFSVWKKQADGTWKVLLDHGISHPEPATDLPLDARDLPPEQRETTDPGKDEGKSKGSFNAEKGFIALSDREGPPSAYRRAITQRTRLLRQNQPPIDGKQAIAQHLLSADGKWTWRVHQEGQSAAGDFAYVLGFYDRQLKPTGTERGHYLRVWMRDPGLQGSWVLAAEILTPKPPPKS